MFLELILGSLAILLVGFLAFSGLKTAKRLKDHRRQAKEPSKERTVYQRMFVDWLTSERVVKVMVQTGTADLQRLQMILDRLPRYSESQLKAFMVVLLKHRAVRMAIASHCAKEHNLPKGRTMSALAELAGIKEAEEVA